MAQQQGYGVLRRWLLLQRGSYAGVTAGAATTALGEQASSSSSSCNTLAATLLRQCRRHPLARSFSSSPAPPGRSGSRLQTWKGPAGQPPPMPPPGVASGVPGAAAAAAAEVPTGPLTWLGSHQVALGSIPPVPKLLGFAGAIPFVTLTPYVVEAAGLPALVDKCAHAQVGYGALIVTFLGAVHWGLAMTSTLTGPRAAAALRERYVWSVFPSLAAWPVLLMETPPGSLIVAVLLGICYLSDRSYARLGSLPSWYMALRGYLTTLATLSMLSTTAFYFAKDVRKAKERMQQEQAEAQELRKKVSVPAPEAIPAPVAAAAPPPAKKGWFK